MQAEINQSKLASHVFERYEDDILFQKTFMPEVLIIDRVAYPFWFFLGFPGAIISIFIWSHRSMRAAGGASAALYQAALCLVDVLFLSVRAPYYLHTSWNIKLLDYPVICEAFPVVSYLLQYLSSTITLIFTVERFLAICYPFRSQRCLIRAGERGAMIVLSVTTLLCLSTSSIQAWFWTFDGRCTSTNFESNSIAAHVRAEWTTVVETLYFAVLPFACLFLNAFVVRIIHRSSKQRNKISVGSVDITTQSFHRVHLNKTVRARTLTLLSLSFYMIAAQFSISVALVIQYFLPQRNYHLRDEQIKTDPIWEAYFNLALVRMIIESCGLSQFAVKLLIYLGTSKQFRREFMHIFGCSKESFLLQQGRRHRTPMPDGGASMAYSFHESCDSSDDRAKRRSHRRHISLPVWKMLDKRRPVYPRPSLGLTRSVIAENGERVPISSTLGQWAPSCD